LQTIEKIKTRLSRFFFKVENPAKKKKKKKNLKPEIM
jgi:hypothetical protein